MSVEDSVIPVRRDAYTVLRGHEFWPAKYEVDAIPDLFDTDGVGRLGDRMVYLHYFLGGTDWWVIELNAKKGLAFGFVRLYGYDDSAAWGMIDLAMLAEIHEPTFSYRCEWNFEFMSRATLMVKRDLQFQPRPAREVLHRSAWEWHDQT